MSDFNNWSNDVQEAAEALRGNWRRFDSFALGSARRRPDIHKRAIVYLSSRDSGLVEKSNEATILAELRKADPHKRDWSEYGASHWAVGHVDGILIRPLRRGKPTKAFRALHECAMAIASYPVLDESDLSRRECEDEDRDWDQWGRRDFRKALTDYFGTECERYPDAALDYLWSRLSDRHNERAWSEESGFAIDDLMERLQEGDIRAALAESRRYSKAADDAA